MTFFVGQNTSCHLKSTSLNGDGASTFWAHTNTPWKSLHENGLVLEEVTIPLRSCGFVHWFFREILKVVIAKSWKFACLSHCFFPFILLFVFVCISPNSSNQKQDWRTLSSFNLQVLPIWLFMFRTLHATNLPPSEKQRRKSHVFSRPSSVRFGFWMKMLALEGGLHWWKLKESTAKLGSKNRHNVKLAIDDDSYIF